MKVTPNPALITGISGTIGRLRFSTSKGTITARRPWTMSAPVTSAQAKQRQAVADSHTLWTTLPDSAAPAWPAFAATLGYSAYAAWNGFNIVALRDDTLTTLTPPHPTYQPVSAQSWGDGAIGAIRATWSYAGPATTNYVTLYYRRHSVLQWTEGPTVWAEALAASLTGLDAGVDYEVALIPWRTVAGPYQGSTHDIRQPGTHDYQDFDTWTLTAPGAFLTTDYTEADAIAMPGSAEARLSQNFGAAYFGPATHLRFQWTPGVHAVASIGAFWGITNTLAPAGQLYADAEPAVILYSYGQAATVRLVLRSCENNEGQYLDDHVQGTTYYVDIERTDATHLVVKTYTDPAFTALFSTLSVVSPADRSYRWATMHNGWGTGGVETRSSEVRELEILTH